MKQPNEYVLKVGESAKLKRGWITTYSLVYAGMLSDYVFSIVLTWTAGHNSAAFNLYLEKGQSEIDILDGRMTILDVNKREIRFHFRK
jgi:hypothetical protein